MLYMLYLPLRWYNIYPHVHSPIIDVVHLLRTLTYHTGFFFL